MTKSEDGTIKSRKRGSGASGTLKRWGIFNLVGLLGIGVQLVVLALLNTWLGIHYLAATVLAVEAAILHNFLWHQRWTWADRIQEGGMLGRLLRFNSTTCITSIVGNLLLMALLVGYFRLHYLLANLISIAVVSMVNFLLSDRLVFKSAAHRPLSVSEGTTRLNRKGLNKRYGILNL